MRLSYGRFFFRGSYWTSYSLTRNTARNRALFLLPRSIHKGKVKEKAMESVNQVMEQINGYFANARGIYWCSSIILTLLGGLLVTAGCRYYKRILFVVGALPTYLVMHCLGNQFGWPEHMAIIVGLLAGLFLILLSWAYIMAWGFWTTVGIVFLVVHPFMASKYATMGSMDWWRFGWMVACFAVGGAWLALIKQRHILIPVTSLTGAGFLVLGVCLLLMGKNPKIFASMTPGVFLITLGVVLLLLAAVGVFVQYRYTAKKQLTMVDIEGEKVVVVKKSKFRYVLLALGCWPFGSHNMYAGRYVKGTIQLLISAFAGYLNFIPLVVPLFWALGNILCVSKNLAVDSKPADRYEEGA